MAHGVFIHRPDSKYDDRPDMQYQFGPQYLTRAQSCIGDWVVYLEPRRVPNARGYFAVARVQDVIHDPAAPGMYLAVMEPGSYLAFPNAVPFNGPDGVLERGVLNAQGRNSGRAQAAVRSLSPEDFARIVDRGLSESNTFLPRIDARESRPGLQEEQMPFGFDLQREKVSQLGSRILRDRVFRRIVLRAYDERCCMTGLKLINGGGRAEAQAAHIQPVEAHGPDLIGNGLALSGTVHWMFDRGLLSVAEDQKILISRQVNDPEAVRGLINRTGRLTLPQWPQDRPHPWFLRWHRENRFKA